MRVGCWPQSDHAADPEVEGIKFGHIPVEPDQATDKKRLLKLYLHKPKLNNLKPHKTGISLMCSLLLYHISFSGRFGSFHSSELLK